MNRYPEESALSRSRWGARLLFAALICAVLAGSGLGSTASAQSLIDYDLDDDGLIEVTTEAQLNAIRWDLDGSGVVDASANATTYAAAFPTAAPQMGCPSAACAGYELAADISLTSSTGVGWEPIGDSTTNFSATFEGDGYTISNLFINRATDNIGLFGVFANTTVIRNLKLTNVNVTGNDNVGALVGANASTSGGGRIDNCEAAGTVSGRSVVGGLVGKNDGPIAGSSASVAVTAIRIDAPVLAGGLVGQNLHCSRSSNSHASGNVSGSHNRIGGLVGSNDDTSAGSSAALPRNAISGSSARGMVSTTGSFAGGLVGWNNGPISNSAALNPSVTGAHTVGGLVGANNDMQNDGTNTISGSTARGTVSGGDTVGGLVGWNNGPISDSAALNPSVTGAKWVGGLVGTNGNTIDRSIATASVLGTEVVGGLVALNGSPIRDSYASGAVRGSSFNTGGLVGQNEPGGQVINSRADGAVDGASEVGGLVGYNNRGSVSGSIATGAVTGNSSSVGGLVGGNQGSISRSAATGAVSGGRAVGGLVGTVVLIMASITESWASGDVSANTLEAEDGSGTGAGGLAGLNNGVVGASFASGNVSGYGAVGGLIGKNWHKVIATYATGNVTVSDMPACSGGSEACPKDAGGLIGLAEAGAGSDVEASYSTGIVSKVSGSAAYRLGGLVGTAVRDAMPALSASFTNSY